MAIAPAAPPPSTVGSQAPDKPAQDVVKGPAEHRRDVIRRAFQRTTEPEAAKPRMGHNQPPEPMEREKPPLDLKKKPTEQTGSDAPRERAEHGHFAAKATPENEKNIPRNIPGGQSTPAPTRPPAPPATWNIVQLPADAPHRNPPRRWSQQAQAEWAAAPESVRASVQRMNKEFSQHYGRMRADTEAMNAIRPFHQMAQQHGTTLDRALNNYVGMENKLRADPIAGLDLIVNNLNLHTPDGQKLTLRDIAWHVLNQTPDQHKTLQLANTQTAISHQMGQLHQQQQAIARGLQQLHYERRFSHTRAGVDRFAETHPRLDELGDLIERELKLGFDLPTAYQRADLLRPATHAAQTRTSAAQTRTSDRSIHGAPDSGSSNGVSRSRSDSKPVGRRDSIANAIKRVNGSL
jgi:hypothetical protein